ncbi:MAG TPA: helix-turn-helix domain-containing protein [Mycobacteriales bacterium]|nr:helix-turn-helix domain-containing protein [Mycobacteriales bacterium]
MGGERPGFDPAKDVVLDPRTLRGIAHPLRVRILSSLREDGPATATALAGRLGESSGATSYHLRQLAAHGFVEEDRERGVGRERWWRSVHRGTYSDLPGPEADQETRQLSEQHLLGVTQMHGLRMRDWMEERPAMPAPWRDEARIGGAILRLTPAEAAELAERIAELVVSYRRDEPDAAAPPEAARVVVQYQVMPRPGRHA